MNLTYSFHALSQYSIRTGRRLASLVEFSEAIKSGKAISLREARENGFNITRVRKGDIYVMWHDTNIKEDVCVIIADNGNVLTLLTKDMYSYKGQERKIRNEMRDTRIKEA